MPSPSKYVRSLYRKLNVQTKQKLSLKQWARLQNLPGEVASTQCEAWLKNKEQQ